MIIFTLAIENKKSSTGFLRLRHIIIPSGTITISYLFTLFT